MLKNTKNSSKKRLFKKRYVVVLSLLFIVSLLIALELSSTINVFGKNSGDVAITPQDDTTKSASIDYGPPKPEDVVISPEKGGIKSDEPDTESGVPSGGINISITRVSRESVGVYIEKLNSGTCELTITQSGVVKITKTASVIAVADYSSCEGFDIDPSTLDPTPFTVKVTVISNNRVGLATQEVK